MSIKAKISKIFSFGFLIIMLMILALATFVEKAKGTPFVAENIYGSWWFIGIWIVIAFCGFLHIIKCKMYKKPITFLLHISFIVILTGAFLTFTTSSEGKIHLRKGKPENTLVNEKNNSRQRLHFDVLLSSFEIEYYPGTQAPYDYISNIKIIRNGIEINGKVSMNKVFSDKGYRFYQMSYDKDLKGTTLLVKSDRYGLPVTYAGYFLLFISMIGYFCIPNTSFRKLLNHPALKQSAIVILIFFGAINIGIANPKSIPEESAKQFGQLQILYKDRICPMQTFSKDFTQKLYGKTSYNSMSSEQVLAGWLFFFDEWKDEPVIKVKGKTVQQLLDLESKYASFSDFFIDGKNYKLAAPLQKIRMGETVEGAKDIIAADEKIQLIFMIQSKTLLKVFPQYVSEKELIWYSPSDELPKNISENERLVIKGSLSLLREYAQQKHWQDFSYTLDKLSVFQRKSAGELLLSPQKIIAEKIFNSFNIVKPIAFSHLLIGIFALVYFFRRENGRGKVDKADKVDKIDKVDKTGIIDKVETWRATSQNKIIPAILNLVLIISGLLILIMISLRGYISGRIPLGNGFETLQFLALCIIVLALIFRKRMFLSIPFGFIFSSLVMLVSMMGSANPQITQLQPVLISPLLSIHVSLIMISYTLFAFVAFIAIAAFISIIISKQKNIELVNNRMLQLSVFSKILLYPALFLLTAGIFVGAIWAEVSWGTYWSWDPKETWALITMIVYALPLHEKSLSLFKRPFFFHFYSLMAMLVVLMTYFGVNYILGGMHSYGGNIGMNVYLIITLVLAVFVVLPLWGYFKYRKMVKQFKNNNNFNFPL
ncbi:cytochrome c biogenesis protein CcsA [Odoribacter sp. OttesenSCG-928-L07]|nr:cytochrome c biogenesis protein CcsA [Odoribacter sp. OttesenSCG-928-L07]MDL2238713.1 cytochrome c biogenesis protein CcsA [Bacteroidales bacterium OttesenSCG-928-L14]